MFRFRHIALGVALSGSLGFAYFGIPAIGTIDYDATLDEAGVDAEEPVSPESEFVVTHLGTPKPLKAIYMTQCVVGTPSFRRDLVALIEATELNAVVIDVKDYSGTIGFPTKSPLLAPNAMISCGATDMREFLGELHDRGIYTIARITVFQDPRMTKQRPDLAIKKYSDQAAVWKDYKGLSFIDVGAREFWDYIVELSKESFLVGFDELNFDYIRFPSDGNMRDIYYPWSEERIVLNPDIGKADVLRDFFAYLHGKLTDPSLYKDLNNAKDKKRKNDTSDEVHAPVLSADLFGMTTTNPDDLNIGQILEYAEPYFDYIAPMVYPSHYPRGFNNWTNPNHYPYEVVKFSLDSGVERLVAASSTPSKLRPWLQDFDYGGNYDAPEVRAQIQATYDSGLDSWMLWAPSNRYTRDALFSADTSGR